MNEKSWFCGEHCCAACRPDLLLSGPRIGEHHFAVRLGDGGPKFEVLLNGEELLGAFEVLAGEHGRVWRFVYHATEAGRAYRVCCDGNRSLMGACFEIVDGNVQVLSLAVA